jgi:Tfp pilus assembly protein PilF
MVGQAPNHSELNRIKGQIESELGETDKAINSLIDALRWDPKNVYALIMMGNIFARDKNDIDTAMKYYEQASSLDPDDNISLNNIGGNLMQIGKLQQAKEFFLKAEKLSSEYPNTKFGLAYVSFSEGMLTEAYEYILQAIKLNKSRDGLFAQSVDLAKAIAQKVNESAAADLAVKTYAGKLEILTGKKIQVQEDPEIPTAAKVELAENHNRDYHLVKYKPGYPGSTHLVLHELTHIELAEEARVAGHHMLFISPPQHRIKFFKEVQIGN